MRHAPPMQLTYRTFSAPDTEALDQIVSDRLAEHWELHGDQYEVSSPDGARWVRQPMTYLGALAELP